MTSGGDKRQGASFVTRKLSTRGIKHAPLNVGNKESIAKRTIAQRALDMPRGICYFLGVPVRPACV